LYGLVELFIASEVEEPNEKNNIRHAAASTPDAVFSSDRLHVFCVCTYTYTKAIQEYGAFTHVSSATALGFLTRKINRWLRAS
jgi:hypothetical protein